MRPARALVLSLAAAPLYYAADAARLLPPSLRDRPWPFALLALLLALPSLRNARLRMLGLATLALSFAALVVIARVRYRLPDSSAAIGAPLPALVLHDQDGRAVDLRAVTAGGKPTLLIWFRGAWCPYCRKELADVARELRPFSDEDLRVLAVAADPPEPLAKLKRELALPFTLLSDPDRQLVARCELSHCDAILDGKGVVRWQVVSGNWERNLPPRALLQAAYRAR
jgi:peroxiredoxin